jgi:hypothetical protein
MQQSISIQFNIVIKIYIYIYFKKKFINTFYYFDIKNKKNYFNIFINKK